MGLSGLVIGIGLIFFANRKGIEWVKIVGVGIIIFNLLPWIVSILLSDTIMRLLFYFLVGAGCVFLIKRHLFKAREIKLWLQASFVNETPEDFFEKIAEIVISNGYEAALEIPIGRAIYFSQSSEDFVPTDSESDFLAFVGNPTKDEKNFSFLEYGWLISSEAIYYRHQEKRVMKWTDVPIYIPFSGAYKVENDVVYYADKSHVSLKLLNDECISFVSSIILEAIESGYTRNLYCGTFKESNDLNNLIRSTVNGKCSDPEESDLDNYINKTQAKLDINKSIGITSGMSVNSLGNHMAQESQINQMLQGRQGHGVAAEWGNTIIDRAMGRSAKTQIGGTNLKYGADRQVRGQLIQTKYCQTYNNGTPVPGDSRASIGSYLENIDGYFQNGVTQVEVPRDQYSDGVKRMKNAIIDGKVPGETNPDNAHLYVRKGFWTMEQAHAITKAGTIPSLTVDALGGIQCALPGASIGAIITYWNARSNGLEKAEALNMTLSVFSKSMIIGTLTYAGTMQLAKKITETGGKNATYKIFSKVAGDTAEQTFKRLNMGLTLVIQLGPSFAKTVTGNQSKADLGSTTTSVGGSFAGMKIGAVVGQAFIPIPGVGLLAGTVIGAMAGGALGNNVGKLIFGESSQSKMLKILKEEFIDTVYQSPLTGDEIKELMEMIFSDKKLNKKLGKMYKSNNRRFYARENLIFVHYSKLLNERCNVDEDEYILLEEQLAFSV